MMLTIALAPECLPGLDPALASRSIETRRAPLLRFRSRPQALDPALARVSGFGAIALTSPRAAGVLGARLNRVSGRAGPLPEVWVSGAGTATVAGDFTEPRLPDDGTGCAALAKAMLEAGVSGPVLYPCGQERREELPLRLRQAGREVREVACYAVRVAPASEIEVALADTDLLLMGSHRLIAAVARALARRPRLICIGPATARTARAEGWEPVAIAESPTVAGILAAISPLHLRAAT